MITTTELENNFRVSGSTVTLQYEKFSTATIPTINLFISNSSNNFGIEFYPEPVSKLTFKTIDGRVVDTYNRITLPPRTGSNVNFVNLNVNIDDTGFDLEQTGTNKLFDIRFNMVALTSNLVTSSNAPPTPPAPSSPPAGDGSGGGSEPGTCNNDAECRIAYPSGTFKCVDGVCVRVNENVV